MSDENLIDKIKDLIEGNEQTTDAAPQDNETTAVLSAHRFAGTDHDAACPVCGQSFDSGIHQTV